MIGSRTAATDAFWERCRRKHGIVVTDYHCSTLTDTDCLDPSVPTLDLSEQPGLILASKKQCTAHMKLDFELNNVPRRQVGDYWLMLNSALQPFVLVRITDVLEQPFIEVPASFARRAGEGEQTLEWGRQAHYDYYIRQCEKLGIEWDENCIVVCEWFEVVEPYSDVGP
jgi:uncharacterized protein YhfF